LGEWSSQGNQLALSEELIMPIKTFTVAIAAALTAILALTACSPAETSAPSAQASSKTVTMRNCSDTSRQTRPDLIQVICASDAITARSLAWSDWGRPVATATGYATVNWCAFEGCAQGEYDSYRVVMIASKLTSCPNGVKGGQQYSRMQYVFVGDDNPFEGIPKHFKLTNELFGSHMPGPANNQTVDLPC
jgi:hypothetical protein